MTGKSTYAATPLHTTSNYLFGRKLPKGVKQVDLVHRPHDLTYAVTWVGADGSRHEYVFDELNEQLEAVLVAMRLTC